MAESFHEIFVNTVIDDGSDTADLMACFEKKEVSNKKFPKLSSRVAELKTTEGGASAVCEVMKKYEEAAKEQARIELLAQLVADNQLDEAIAAARLNVSVEVFRDMCNKVKIA